MTKDDPLPFLDGLARPAAADAVEADPTIESLVVDLYEQVRRPVVAYACHLLGSIEDAEDLTQVAFVRLYEQLRQGVDVQNVRGWIYRVVHNLAVDQVRRSQTLRQVLSTLDGQPDARDGTTSAETSIIRRQQIAHALQRLNERERHCLMLRSEGLSYEEVGQVLGISAKSVSVYLARGLKKFAASGEGDHDAATRA